MKGICGRCGAFDELYIYTLSDLTDIEVCKDCLDEISERDHDIYEDDYMDYDWGDE